ncbi:unnamed protein product [Calicophoron daubneyi]|uniref:Ribosomal protein L20 n=1 Tax=Calicophoron daubneyi TaxID=300641 RepID=A0AAV2TLR1_CALDB
MRLTDVLLLRKVVYSGKSDPWFKKDQIMKFAFLFRGRHARCPKLGINMVHKAFQYMHDLRRVRKREMKELWLERLRIASEQCGLPSERVLLEGLAQSNIALNSNILQLLAVYEPRTFSALADIAKKCNIEKGVALPNPKTSCNVITRGMLGSPLVPGNKKLYE